MACFNINWEIAFYGLKIVNLLFVGNTFTGFVVLKNTDYLLHPLKAVKKQ